MINRHLKPYNHKQNQDKPPKMYFSKAIFLKHQKNKSKNPRKKWKQPLETFRNPIKHYKTILDLLKNPRKNKK